LPVAAARHFLREFGLDQQLVDPALHERQRALDFRRDREALLSLCM
jgi:hypothetical protein